MSIEGELIDSRLELHEVRRHEELEQRLAELAGQIDALCAERDDLHRRIEEHSASYHHPEPIEEAAAAEEPEAEAAEDVVIEPLAEVAEDEKPEAEPPPPSPHLMFRRVGGRD